MNRKKFLKTTLKASAVFMSASVGGVFAFDHHFSQRTESKRILTFNSLEEALREIEQLKQAAQIDLAGEWSLYQNLVHCSQSIEYSMIGYPENKSAVFQKTIGSWVFDKFESQGYMKHNRNEAIPKAPPIEKEGNLQHAFDRLITAIHKFDTFQGQFSPHFAYGELSKQEYAKAHSMHLADHFSAIAYKF